MSCSRRIHKFLRNFLCWQVPGCIYIYSFKSMPIVNVINIFSSSLMKRPNKLEYLNSYELNIILGWKGLPWANTLTYLASWSVTMKKVYNIENKCQCYFTFLSSSRTLFQIRWSGCLTGFFGLV
jgi:hypothetical protein